MDYEIIKFEATAHPLGNEVDIRWEFANDLPSGYRFYLFKRSQKDIEDSIINDYIANPTGSSKPKDVFVFYEIGNTIMSMADIFVREGEHYYYKGIVVNTNDVSIKSAIQNANIENPTFSADINVSPAKEYVIEAVTKIMEAVAEQKGAKIQVYREFPLEINENLFVTVTRASNESAYKVWGDVLIPSDNSLTRGDFDSDVIQINWFALNAPLLRDKITDIFRGSKFKIKRYLRFRGILDVSMVIMNDGFEDVGGKFFVYCGMLIRCLIENQVTTENETPLGQAITYKLQFNAADLET